MKLPRTLFIAYLGAAPLCAQQVAPKADPQKLPPAEAGGVSDGASSRGNILPPPPVQTQTTYIGVLTRAVPAELRAQFSLAEGFGLLVDEVLPDSPAKAAGLKEYDVLVKFEDQQLVNMDQFMSLVRARKKGDVVQLDVISGGRQTKVPVTLGEHVVEAHEHLRHHGGMPPNGAPAFNGERFRGDAQRGFQDQARALNDQFGRLQHLQQELREYQQRVQEWSKGGGQGPMPQPPSLKLPGHEADPQFPEGGRYRNSHQPQTGISIPPGTNLQRFNFTQSQSGTDVTRKDASGEFAVKNANGQKTFIAHPAGGKEQSFPINTEAERQAVPPEFRDKLHALESTTTTNGNGVRIEINPGQGLPVPGTSAPTPSENGNDAPVLPPVKGKTTSA